jgi:hypothetical protein
MNGRSLSPTTSVGLFAFLLTIVSVVAVEAEYRLDPYGARRAEGPHALRELDPQFVKQMFVGDRPILEYDKFVTFDVGTKMFGGVLLDRKDRFRHGEAIVVQCRLNPPHEDMWVECNLHDASNLVVDRVGQVVVRSQLRGNFMYRAADALLPGTYFLVLRTGGQEITRRRIEITYAASTPLAN